MQNRKRERANAKKNSRLAPLEDAAIVTNILSFLDDASPDSSHTMQQLASVNRFFNRQVKEAYWFKNPAYVMNGIRALRQEIRIACEVVLPTLDNSPCNVRHVLFTLPEDTDIDIDDELIQQIQSLCQWNKVILHSLMYSRDGVFMGGKASAGVGTLMLLLGFSSLGLEALLLAVCMAGILLYLDKKMINNGVLRDHYWPKREDIFSSPRYNALLYRYSKLKTLCQAWLQLDPDVKEDFLQEGSLLRLKDEDVVDNGLRSELSPLALKN